MNNSRDKNHQTGDEPERALRLDNLLQAFPAENDSRIRWLASILNSTYEGIVVINYDATIIFANVAYTHFLGVPISKILGKKLSEIEPDSPILAVLQSGKPIADNAYYIKSLGGLDIYANINPIYENNQLIGAVAVFRDRDEIQHLEEKLQVSLEEAPANRVLANRFFSDLKELCAPLSETGDLVLESRSMRKIAALVFRLNRVDSTVLITGESGTGKSVIAKFIHNTSSRNLQPFVTINCGSIPENLLESELFGYEKGAFTGASKEGKIGLLKMADRGTLFLDEISELPYNLQVKLLRVIQEQKFMRLGSVRETKVDVRFLAAANRDLKTLVREKSFREDLYYRLNVIPLELPPLRLRKQDVAPLARHFLQKFNHKYRQQKILLPGVYRRLEHYAWPGNVRELENLMERLVVSTLEDTITLQDETLIDFLSSEHLVQSITIHDIIPLGKAQAIMEKDLIKNALDQYGSARQAAKALEVDHSTLLRKARKYKIPLNSQKPF